MRSQLLLQLLLSASAGILMVWGQSDSTSGTPAIDPDFIEFQADGIDYPGCMQDLVTADRNKDGVLKQNEYLDFIQTYGERICYVTDRLSLKQRAAFIALACRCQGLEGFSGDCCVGNNARILTDGALNPSRTQEQKFYLTAVCRVTDGTMEGQRGCPPTFRDPDEPPPYTIVAPPAAAAAAAPAEGGLSPGAIAGIVIAALALLLLLLCCCCIVCRRKRGVGEEEEELQKQTDVEENMEEVPEQSPGDLEKDIEIGEEVPAPPVAAMPPQAPQRDVPPVAPMMVQKVPQEESESEEEVVAAAGRADIEDEDEEEEVVKARGSALIPPEEEENNRRLRAAGELPPEENEMDKIKLRPVESEEAEEDPDWDQPGRLIDEPKEKDDMSAGEVEHYEPDGGVYIPERPQKEPLDWKNKWERPEVEDPDDHDNRKHRIQAGLGDGEVWDKLNENDDDDQSKKGGGGDVFDWVVQSALGVLNTSEQAGHLDAPDFKANP